MKLKALRPIIEQDMDKINFYCNGIILKEKTPHGMKSFSKKHPEWNGHFEVFINKTKKGWITRFLHIKVSRLPNKKVALNVAKALVQSYIQYTYDIIGD